MHAIVSMFPKKYERGEIKHTDRVRLVNISHKVAKKIKKDYEDMLERRRKDARYQEKKKKKEVEKKRETMTQDEFL